MPKIIIIEDDKDILDVMTYILTEEGYEVVGAPDSAPLLQLDQIQPFLVLMDNRLVEGTGTELCYKLKTNLATAHFPIAIISAHNNLEEIAKESMADAFLKKPFDIDELLSLVKRFG